jgi:hypothetical protein
MAEAIGSTRKTSFVHHSREEDEIVRFELHGCGPLQLPTRFRLFEAPLIVAKVEQCYPF